MSDNETETESSEEETTTEPTPEPEAKAKPPRTFKTKDGKTVTIGGELKNTTKSLWSWLKGSVGDKD